MRIRTIVSVMELPKAVLEDANALWSWLLRGSQGLFGSKSGTEGGTDINKAGRTLRKK